MLVFKKNWIYRYNEWCHGNMFTIGNVNDSKSICSYFWKTMWNLVPVNLMYSMIAHTPAVAGLWLKKFEYFDKLTGLPALYTFLVAGYLSLAAFGLILVGLAIIQSKFENRKQNSDKSPNLVIEYIKTKKSKICPMIEWED
ncbi:hypothetical protein [Vibrio phage JSF13]|jgi:hypothetical protein|uniref:Uncharacterized protein ORF169 n=1 Tax=Vibrio phage ICP1 TaxID=979525 RepID=F1D1J2_9CAUD|nr:membrane protein [Vibrio phage ICP1]ADX88211.1 hypothetical protein TUST1-191_00825 [Vibrio phage ICP1_2006_D]ADX88438.1 hypothetical protein TUST1-182_00825 [Vibrio phage ICP1_2006_C]ADX88889.1 hypothetical protein TUST1-17_00815 [Vibrio phage ICP1_2006_A]ADX89119.1 hypothetical protein TUST1-15_00835 [Vibrio phage ICP1_2005_A]ADX89349.1 hypothetical protein TUST1-2_00845 [Vibrio phage ICP1_2001_A]ADX89576.1 hypothetical protein TUST1-10_00820 [Vibrio phage ICP1_2004_A]APD17974.1 hypothe